MPPVEILVGDAAVVLQGMPAESVQVAVTSPPYFGLRNYGAEGQIGLEDTPEAYAARLVQVFREVRRVLRPDGTLWLNLGDSYAGSWGAQAKRETPEQEGWRNSIRNHPKMRRAGGAHRFGDAKPKDLLMIPAMVALALRADGWWLRKDIIWAKPNPMPESVEDRPTSAHEHVFLLAKSERYFYDAEAIKEPCDSGPSDLRKMVEAKPRIGGKHKALDDVFSKASGATNIGQKRSVGSPDGRNARDVWTIGSEPCGDQLCQDCGRYFTSGDMARLRKVDEGDAKVCRCGSHTGWLAHFATMPATLAERCILAGTSAAGGCGTCGAPWVRVMGDAEATGGRGAGNGFKRPARLSFADSDGARGDETPWVPKARATTGWRPTCSCGAPAVPQRVLDPFGGAGTTALAARRLQRRVTLAEIHPGYARLAEARVRADAPLLEAAS